MKTANFYKLLASALLFAGCASQMDSDMADPKGEGSSVSTGSNGQSQNNQSGLITAGEWNDLENWSFWNGLAQNKDFSTGADEWMFYPRHRMSVVVKSNNGLVVDAPVKLLYQDDIVWECKTDNQGKAEMWIELFKTSESIDPANYTLTVAGQPIDQPLKLYQDGVNEIELSAGVAPSTRVELSFIVDATGSMSDELEFLKDDLSDVIQKVESHDPTLDIYTSTVFYRDEGDDYLVRKSGFSNDLEVSLDFINNQTADGGGDFPEAVHTALKTGIDELQWSSTARTRIAFLLLDAPPHLEAEVIGDLQKSIKEAARKGIKVIPITASGIDKATEFLMRSFAISTNGTYVFITDHSGIGNDHLEATVGEYQVEYLNNLMVRLINEYSE